MAASLPLLSSCELWNEGRVDRKDGLLRRAPSFKSLIEKLGVIDYYESYPPFSWTHNSKLTFLLIFLYPVSSSKEWQANCLCEKAGWNTQFLQMKNCGFSEAEQFSSSSLQVLFGFFFSFVYFVLIIAVLSMFRSYQIWNLIFSELGIRSLSWQKI